MINQQLIKQLLINLLFAGLQVSKLVIQTGLLYPLDHHFTLNQVCSLNLEWSWKSMKFQWISNTIKYHQNGLPRSPKVTKMRPQEVPKVVKITKILKKLNLIKTLIVAIQLKGSAIRICQTFHSKISKWRDCNPNVILDCSNQRKYEKVIQNGLQWETQNPSKITEMQFWSRLSAPLHPMITKIMKKLCPKSQNACKMVSQDLEKSTNLWSKINEICLKRMMQLLKFPMISILQIFQIHQVCKSTVNWLPEGPAAGAKP